MLAVALLEEALELRRADIKLPLLILGALTPAQVPVAVENGFIQGIVGPEQLREACAYSRRTGKSLPVHLKLDTGMGRVGLIEDDLPEAIDLLKEAEGVRVEGIYTHFASAADPGHPLTAAQSMLFDSMLGALEAGGVSAPIHHLANSAAAAQGLVKAGEYVRAGMILLGGETLDRGDTRLESVMTWTTRVMRLKNVPAGAYIGYGAAFRTTRPSKIATLPVGYADGFNRLLSNGGQVLLRGRRAPVTGRVSMDLVSIDVTDIPEASVGDEVVLLGRQEDERIAAEEIAAKLGTIPYEVFCSVSSRVPRFYRSGSERSLRSKFIT
jgi:alanine racemase